jgi:hypothetical protein
MGALFKAIKANILAQGHMRTKDNAPSKALPGWCALNAYANSCGVSNTALTADSTFHMKASSAALVKGGDCPHIAGDGHESGRSLAS